ncbi:MAG: DUF4384 domain-containing protein, partial [Blastocatellia bacterium]
EVERIQVTILLQQADGSLEPVPPEREFNPGEIVKVGIECNVPAYVYIVNFASSGKKTVIFPEGNESNLLEANKLHTLPQSYDLVFEGKKGFETFQVFVSRERIAFLDTAVHSQKGELNAEQTRAIAEMWKDDNRPQQPGITSNEDTSRDPRFDKKAKTTVRFPRFDPVFDKKTRTTTITGAPGRQQGSQDRSSRIIPFRINLRNTGGQK